MLPSGSVAVRVRWSVAASKRTRVPAGSGCQGGRAYAGRAPGAATSPLPSPSLPSPFFPSPFFGASFLGSSFFGSSFFGSSFFGSSFFLPSLFFSSAGGVNVTSSGSGVVPRRARPASVADSWCQRVSRSAPSRTRAYSAASASAFSRAVRSIASNSSTRARAASRASVTAVSASRFTRASRSTASWRCSSRSSAQPSCAGSAARASSSRACSAPRAATTSGSVSSAAIRASRSRWARSSAASRAGPSSRRRSQYFLSAAVHALSALVTASHALPTFGGNPVSSISPSCRAMSSRTQASTVVSVSTACGARLVCPNGLRSTRTALLSLAWWWTAATLSQVVGMAKRNERVVLGLTLTEASRSPDWARASDSVEESPGPEAPIWLEPVFWEEVRGPPPSEDSVVPTRAADMPPPWVSRLGASCFIPSVTVRSWAPRKSGLEYIRRSPSAPPKKPLSVSPGIWYPSGFSVWS